MSLSVIVLQDHIKEQRLKNQGKKTIKLMQSLHTGQKITAIA
jgi:hypothetical protein